MLKQRVDTYFTKNMIAVQCNYTIMKQLFKNGFVLIYETTRDRMYNNFSDRYNFNTTFQEICRMINASLFQFNNNDTF